MTVFSPATDTARESRDARDSCPPLPVLGHDVRVPLVTGGEVGYAALDYAASAPALQRVWDDVAAYAPYYGSVHRGAAISPSSPPISSSRAGPPSPRSSAAGPTTR